MAIFAVTPPRVDSVAFMPIFMGALGLTMLINIALAVAYEAYFLTTRGATLGKQVLGLKVIRSDGSGISLGVAIGRSTVPTTPALSVARADLPYRVAAAQYLTRTEALLTGFRTDSRPGAADSQFVAQARDLLLTTRLMLDSPVAKSAPMRALLEDLEVVLAQIATLPSSQNAEDVKLINEGIEQRSVLLRLRTSVPAGTQGAL